MNVVMLDEREGAKENQLPPDKDRPRASADLPHADDFLTDLDKGEFSDARALGGASQLRTNLHPTAVTRPTRRTSGSPS